MLHLSFYVFTYFTYVRVGISGGLGAMSVEEAREGVIFHRTGAAGIGTCLMWVLGPLKEQRVPLTTEPSSVHLI